MMWVARFALLGVCLGAGFSLASPASLREILEVTDLSSLAIAPDGHAVAVRLSRDDLATNRRIEQWMIVSLDKSDDARVVIDAGEPDWHKNGPAAGPISTEAPRWSADSQWIYYRSIRDAQVQVWRWSGRGEPQQLTRDEADIEQFVLDPASGSLIYSVRATRAEIAAAERAEYLSGVLFDASVEPGEAMVRNHPVNGRMMTYRRAVGSDRVSGNVTLLSDRPLEIKVLDLATLAVTQASPVQQAAYRQLAGIQSSRSWHSNEIALSGGAGTVVVTRKPLRERPLAAPDLREQIELARGDGAKTACADPACQGEGGQITLVGWKAQGTLVFTKRDYHGTGLHLWDVRSNRVRRIAFTEGDFAEDRNATGPCRLTRREAICVFAAADTAPRLIAISLDTGAARTLLDPNLPLNPARLGRTSRMVISDGAGNESFGFLVLPRDYRKGTRLPLVITDYVCNGFIRPEDDVSEHVLASLGIAAFCLEDSYATRRAIPEHVASTEAAYGEAAVALRKAVVAQLDAKGIIDPSRVGLAGMSGGATAVTYVLSRSNAFRAGLITTASYGDVMSGYLNGALAWVHGKSADGKPASIEEQFAPASPALKAMNMPPLLMLLPDREYITNLQLYTAMLTHGRPVEMIVYPDEFHIKNQPQHRLSAYQRAIDWFRFWLQGEEDAAPAKADQYRRWREFRSRSQSPAE